MLDASVSNVQCYYLEKGLQIFQQSVSHLKILGAYLGDVKQVPYWGLNKNQMTPYKISCL